MKTTVQKTLPPITLALLLLTASAGGLFAQQEDYGRAVKATGPSAWRKVDGKIYNCLTDKDWTTLPPDPHYFEGGSYFLKVVKDTTNGTICRLDYFSARHGDEMGREILLKNYPDKSALISDKLLKDVRALKIGKAQTQYSTIEAYDCGVVCGPPPELIATQAQARSNAVASAVVKKQKAADAALKANQEAAARGEAYGLLRMGERYRDGEGVEKDLAKARDYLTRAAAAGNDTAQKALDAL